METEQLKNKPDFRERLVSVFLVLVPYLITGCISAIIGILMFRTKEIAPYGEKCVLNLDLWGQYFPMYFNNRQAESLSDMMYSWNGAFGFNNWAQSAYYCNSIFLLFFKFIPLRKLVTALDIFCLLKIVCSSVSCMAFLKYKIKERTPILVAGAVGYSTCAYMLAFMTQFMWTDCLIYAPLVLIGLERLIHEKKPVFYAVMLGISILSSFYIGFAMCIFSVLYFIANSVLLLHVERTEGKLHFTGQKNWLSAAGYFAVFSVLAGALSAVMIIPVGYAISQTLAAENPAPDTLEWYGNITSVLQDMLPNQVLHLEYTGANLFTGLAVFIGIPLYFSNEKIRRAERIADGCMLGFLLISLNCNIMNYVWHGFHFPNQLPARWSFLCSLYAVLLTCKGLAYAPNLKPVQVLKSCVIGMLVFYITEAGLGSTEPYEFLPAGAWRSLAGIALILMIESVSGKVLKEYDKNASFIKQYVLNRKSILFWTAILTALIMVVDSGKSFLTVSTYEGSKGLQVSNEQSYTNSMAKSVKYGRQWKNDNTDFYRMDANSGHTFNNSMFGDFHGMRYYSSTMNGKVFKFLKFMGNRVYADKVSTVYSLSSPVQNSLFGMKYFMDFDKNLNNIVPNMTLVEENEEGNFYENPKTLPLAYGVSDNILQYEVTEEVRAIENQNHLVNDMCGEEINPYRVMNCEQFSYENVTLQENQDWNQNFFMNETDQPTRFHYTYAADKDGAYFIEHNFRAGKIHVTYGDKEKTLHPGDGGFAYVGLLNAGDTLTIDVEMEGVQLGCCGLNAYYLDEEAWEHAYEKLSSQGLNVTSFKSTQVKGTISMKEAGLVFSSIPQDGGWDVYCDGRKLSTQTAGEILLCFYVPAGEHEITLRYHVRGFTVGLIISLISLILLILYTQREKFFKKKEVQPVEETAEPELTV